MISHVESNERNKQTNKIETEAWARGTDWQLSDGRGTGWKKAKELPKNTYAWPIDTNDSVVMARGKGVGQGGSGEGHICNSVNNKNKELHWSSVNELCSSHYFSVFCSNFYYTVITVLWKNRNSAIKSCRQEYFGEDRVFDFHLNSSMLTRLVRFSIPGMNFVILFFYQLIYFP